MASAFHFAQLGRMSELFLQPPTLQNHMHHQGPHESLGLEFINGRELPHCHSREIPCLLSDNDMKHGTNLRNGLLLQWHSMFGSCKWKWNLMPQKVVCELSSTSTTKTFKRTDPMEVGEDSWKLLCEAASWNETLEVQVSNDLACH